MTKDTRFKKGMIPWNKDKTGYKTKPASEERKMKMSQIMKGKKGHPAWNKNLNIQLNTGKTHFKKGQLPHNYKGGSTNWAGYKLVHVNGKQVREHRLIMENYLGRKLKKAEQQGA